MTETTDMMQEAVINLYKALGLSNRIDTNTWANGKTGVYAAVEKGVHKALRGMGMTPRQAAAFHNVALRSGEVFGIYWQ